MTRFFDGIRFLAFHHDPQCSAWVNRSFGYSAVNYAAQGHLFWSTDGVSHVRIDAPVFYWTLPNHHYRYGSRDGTSWDHRWVAFEGPRVEEYLASGLLGDGHEAPFISVRTRTAMRQAFDDLHAYLAAPDQGTSRAAVLLESLLLLAHDQPRFPEPSQPYHEEITQLADTISRSPGDTVDFRAAARTLGLSLSRFRHVFRTVTGTPPHAFLLRARLNHAAALLRSGHFAVSQACLRAGFDNPALFSRQFKQAFHTTAREYRKRHLLS